MKNKIVAVGVAISSALAVLTAGAADSLQDRYSLKVPNGLEFAEFKGYAQWELISISYNDGVLAAILGNPAMIEAFKEGIPDNGKPFPDGVKMAKIHWNPIKNDRAPGPPLVPDTLHDIDFMVKDRKKFADSNGWGYAAFDYDNATATFKPSDGASHPPQANDAKCGAACHTVAAKRDYVFTTYPKR